jgi:predicted GTPase
MTSNGSPRRILIMGAAGRDFHNFNVVYRDDLRANVVAFTAAQIPGTSGRRYPSSLAGQHYPNGIPILEEEQLSQICRELSVDEVIFAYSDVAHASVMHKASIALAAGADFILLGPHATMIASKRPVIAVCAVRTGVGKSQVTRWLVGRLTAAGMSPAVLRHPMPYGDLETEAVQRFASMADLDAARCTLEEREEYEPHIAAGGIVFAGVDYEKILERAEQEADIILWDGGNNDFPFIKPDLLIVLVDPLRAGHEISYHPGEAVLRMADVVVVAKCNAAAEVDIRRVIESANELASSAKVIRAQSVVTLDEPAAVAGKRVIVVDDGPTLTHGGMAYGAGYVAATQAGAGEIVDPRKSAVGDILRVFQAFPHIGKVLPAMGYSPSELADLAETINKSAAEVVVAGTPTDLAHVARLRKPVVRARYDYAERQEPGLDAVIDEFLRARGLRKSSIGE